MKLNNHWTVLAALLLGLLAARCGQSPPLQPPPTSTSTSTPTPTPVASTAPKRLEVVTEKEVTFYPTYGHRKGNGWNIRLRGWAHKDREHLNQLVTKLATIRDRCSQSDMRSFQSRTNDLEDDDKAFEKVIIKFDSDPEDQVYEFEERSNSNGIVEQDLSLTDERARQLLAGQGSTNGWLTYRAVSREHTGLGRIRLIEPEGDSFITDIDDTIKITQIPAGESVVLRNTFCLDFKAAPGMVQQYRELGDVPVHYISGGPQQMFWPLYDFLITGAGGFPEGTFHLNSYPKNLLERETVSNLIKLAAGGPFDSTYTHKVREITSLMEDFPRRQFILIGDSGEVDPEVYSEIRRTRPGQVKEIRIRDLVNDRDPNGNPYRLEGMTILKVAPVVCIEERHFQKLSQEVKQRHPGREYRRPPHRELASILRARQIATRSKLRRLRRVKKERQHDGRKECSGARYQKQTSEIHDARAVERFTHQPRSKNVGHQRTEPEDHQVEQSLSARTHVGGKELIDEDVDGREEERVADAVQHIHENDDGLLLRQEGKHREARRVAENPDDHRGAPAKVLQRYSQDQHGQDFRNLPDAHHRHDPVAGDAHAAGGSRGAEKRAGPVEEQIVHRRIYEGHQP